MANRAQAILDSVKNRVAPDIYESIEAVCGIPDDHATPAVQARHVAALMQKLSRHCTPDEISEIMRPCGHRCISDHTIETAKKLYADSADLPDFLRRLNERRIGGGQLHIEGDHIVGVYDRCYCGLAKSTKDLSPDYCECSAGWFEKLFSSVLGKDVAVTQRGTILSGALECTFEIRWEKCS